MVKEHVENLWVPACRGQPIDISSFTCILEVGDLILHFVGLLLIWKIGHLVPLPFGLGQSCDSVKAYQQKLD
jgi:hypothetical protein